jgi:hypothetical protein
MRLSPETRNPTTGRMVGLIAQIIFEVFGKTKQSSSHRRGRWLMSTI